MRFHFLPCCSLLPDKETWASMREDLFSFCGGLRIFWNDRPDPLTDKSAFMIMMMTYILISLGLLEDFLSFDFYDILLRHCMLYFIRQMHDLAGEVC